MFQQFAVYGNFEKRDYERAGGDTTGLPFSLLKLLGSTYTGRL
jgi:hypothetical protein